MFREEELEEQGRITVVIIRQGWGQRDREGPHDKPSRYLLNTTCTALMIPSITAPVIPRPSIPGFSILSKRTSALQYTSEEHVELCTYPATLG